MQTLTVGDINVNAVRTWFREHNLWLQRSNGTMMGPLQAAYDAATQQAKDGLDYLYDTVFAKSAEHLRTTDPVWSVQVKALVDLVVQLSPQASGLVDSFYSLDGGRPYKDLTVEQFAADAATETEAADKAEYLATQLATLQAVIDPVQTKLNAIATWGQTAEVLALSVAEYEAYIDGLMATTDGNPA